MKKVLLGTLLSVVSALAIEVGSIPPAVTLDGANGGNVNGSAWSSSMLKGKVYVLFYVDPDEKDLNQAVTHALKKEHFDRKSYGSVAVVNLAATWKPNAIIEALLKKKQKEFPDTTYVMDKKRVLVNKWQLADDNSDILLFDKNGKLLFKKFGKLSQQEIHQLITLIKSHM